MLRSLFGGGDISYILPLILLRIPAILLSLSLHESAHGYMSYKLGDPTARSLGRITLDPFKHLDLFGTISLLLFGFGWAKPVPVNTRYYKKPRRDMMLTALAGPVSNLLLGFVSLLAYCIAAVYLSQMAYGNDIASNIAYYFLLFLQILFTMNVSLAVFNLIPIPPLDGSRIFFVLLPDKLYFGFMKYERIIMTIVLVLMFTTNIFGEIITFVSTPIYNFMYFLADKIIFWI